MHERYISSDDCREAYGLISSSCSTMLITVVCVGRSSLVHGQ